LVLHPEYLDALPRTLCVVRLAGTTVLPFQPTRSGVQAKCNRNNRWRANIRKPMKGPQEREASGPRINEFIRVREVRLIDQNGAQLGVMATIEARQKAVDAGLDLVEISPDAQPPVCKILDYGKYKYEQQKKAAEARKNQKIVELKEIKVRPGIDDHDYDVKMRAIKRFFEEGDKVKVTLRFRGREMAHASLGMDVLKRIKADTEPIAKVESEPRFEGRQMIMILAPK
jgi:translation initiation factor IF-3